MSIRKLMILLITLCLLTVAVTLVATQLLTGRGGDNEQSAIFAYLTSREFILMRGGSVVARVPQVFDEADASNRKVVWTHSGGHAVFFSDAGIRVGDPASKELVSVNIHDGMTVRIPCASCEDFVAVDEDSILLEMYDKQRRGSTLSQVDLNSPNLPARPRPPSRIEGPPGQTQGYVRRFLASTRDYVVTGQTVQVGSSSLQERIEVLKADGSSTIYSDLLDSNAVAIRATGDGNTLIAIVSKVTPASCASRQEISVRYIKGRTSKTDMSAAEPPPAAVGGIRLNDLWWSPNGQLYATIASMTCDETKPSLVEQRILERPSALWRLDGQKWVSDNPEPATVVRQLGQRTRIILAIPDCIGPVSQPDRQVYCHTGTLFLDQSGDRKQFAEHVLAISTPPA